MCKCCFRSGIKMSVKTIRIIACEHTHAESVLPVLKPSAQPDGLSPTTCNQDLGGESSLSGSEGKGKKLRMWPQQSKRAGKGLRGRRARCHGGLLELFIQTRKARSSPTLRSATGPRAPATFLYKYFLIRGKVKTTCQLGERKSVDFRD